MYGKEAEEGQGLYLSRKGRKNLGSPRAAYVFEIYHPYLASRVKGRQNF
jgi:hypothetical protein